MYTTSVPDQFRTLSRSFFRCRIHAVVNATAANLLLYGFAKPQAPFCHPLDTFENVQFSIRTLYKQYGGEVQCLTDSTRCRPLTFRAIFDFDYFLVWCWIEQFGCGDGLKMMTNSVKKQEQVTTGNNNKQKKNHKDGEKKTFAKMSIGEKVRHLREVVTVEPVMGKYKNTFSERT